MKSRSILIPFNAWSRERIEEGRKICTSRHKKYLHDPRVIHITDKLPWGFIRKKYWELEGAESENELQNVIEDIMKRPVPDNELFYVHFGKYIKDKKPE